MKYTSRCFFAKGVPTDGYSHLIIVAIDNGNDVILAPISSIKPNKYYDKACEINPEDMPISNNGRSTLTKRSFVRYQWIFRTSHKEIENKQNKGIYEIRCRVSSDLVEKIRQGALISEEIEPIYKNFFKK